MKMYDPRFDSESNDGASSSGKGIPDAASDANFMCTETSDRSRKTQLTYEKNYQDFINWQSSNRKKSFNEEVILEYFLELSEKFKSSTLAFHFYILRNKLNQNHDVDISRYSKVTSFLKEKAEGFTGKQSKTFSPEEINKFLKEAPNDQYLSAKVASIFGIVGACRRQELHKLQFKDVELLGSRVVVKINNTKTKTNRIFTVTGDYYELCKKYISLRPSNCISKGFFVHYKAGKHTSLNVGINQFGNLGKTIAKYLGLPNPNLYTGHCFRRTSATVLVDPDGDILPLKGHNLRKKTIEPDSDGYNDRSLRSSYANEGTENNSYPSTNIKEGSSCNSMESNSEDLNQFLRSFENQDIELVNINITRPNIEDKDNLSESKEEVQKQVRNFLNKNNDVNIKSPGIRASEEYIDNSIDDEEQQREVSSQSPLGANTNKVVNINISGTSTNLRKDLTTLVRFDNCKIQNIHIYYDK